MILSRAVVASLLLALAWPGGATARPTDVIHPGGIPSESDTLVFDYPVLRSPSLLSLRAPSLLSAPDAVASVADSTRRAPDAGVTRADPTVSGPSAPGVGSLLFSGSKSLSVEMSVR